MSVITIKQVHDACIDKLLNLLRVKSLHLDSKSLVDLVRDVWHVWASIQPISVSPIINDRQADSKVIDEVTQIVLFFVKVVVRLVRVIKASLVECETFNLAVKYFESNVFIDRVNCLLDDAVASITECDLQVRGIGCELSCESDDPIADLCGVWAGTCAWVADSFALGARAVPESKDNHSIAWVDRSLGDVSIAFDSG